MSVSISQQELLCALKEMAIELGRTPTATEFRQRVKGARYKWEAAFGSFSTMVQASGLDPAPGSRVKIDNSVFERDIEKHIEAYSPRQVPSKQEYETTVFIPDIHFPFAHQPTLEAVYRFIEKEQPTNVVQLGDLYDFYSHSKFPRSHNVFTPRDEKTLARSQAEIFWGEVTKAAPKARKFQLRGNHDDRPLKRMLEAYPVGEDWIEKMVTEMMSFTGVETLLDSREELMFPGDVMVIHGYRSNLGGHRDFALMNSVCGHQHVGGAVFRQIRGRTLWELNCGLAGDPEAKGLTYSSQRMTKWTLGWGFLDEFGPRFIPLR